MGKRRKLLGCGAAGAASFVLIIVVNDALRPSYQPMHDFVSEAAIGRHGWVQIANFVTSGVLIAASSFALSRAVNPWTGRLVRVFGVSLMLAGVFVSDPVPHEQTTWHGDAHNLVSVIVFVSLTLACFTAARWRPTPGWRWYCALTGIAVPALFVTAGAASGTAGLWQRLSIVVGWTWLIVLGLRAMRDPLSPASPASREEAAPPGLQQ
jgi:hypothetical membrane protein